MRIPSDSDESAHRVEENEDSIILSRMVCACLVFIEAFSAQRYMS
jgi:hypothetical protein